MAEGPFRPLSRYTTNPARRRATWPSRSSDGAARLSWPTRRERAIGQGERTLGYVSHVTQAIASAVTIATIKGKAACCASARDFGSIPASNDQGNAEDRKRPAARCIGAARAKAPSTINRAPATRFLTTREDRGMARYLYAIDVKVAADGKATGGLSIICEVTDRPASRLPLSHLQVRRRPRLLARPFCAALRK